MADEKKSDGVPVQVCKQISEKYNQDQVILITYDSKKHLTQVVTYGNSEDLCEQACAFENSLKKEFGLVNKMHETIKGLTVDFEPDLAGINKLHNTLETLTGEDDKDFIIQENGIDCDFKVHTKIKDTRELSNIIEKLHGVRYSSFQFGYVVNVNIGGVFSKQAIIKAVEEEACKYFKSVNNIEI